MKPGRMIEYFPLPGRAQCPGLLQYASFCGQAIHISTVQYSPVQSNTIHTMKCNGYFQKCCGVINNIAKNTLESAEEIFKHTQ